MSNARPNAWFALRELGRRGLADLQRRRAAVGRVHGDGPPWAILMWVASLGGGRAAASETDVAAGIGLGNEVIRRWVDLLISDGLLLRDRTARLRLSEHAATALMNYAFEPPFAWPE